MYGVPQAGLTVPAVAGQLERGVRRHLAPEAGNLACCPTANSYAFVF
jgi:hypothetical protein